MAEESLLLLDLTGTEQVRNIGCGSGKTTAEIAARVPQGAVAGVDASADIIAFARAHCDRALYPHLQFAIADARHLPYQNDQTMCSIANGWWPPMRREKGISSARTMDITLFPR